MGLTGFRSALTATVFAAPGACATPSMADPGQICPSFVNQGQEAEEIRRLELRGAAVNVEGWSEEEARAFFAPEWFSVQLDGTRAWSGLGGEL